jgi:hypothetical protein
VSKDRTRKLDMVERGKMTSRENEKKVEKVKEGD